MSSESDLVTALSERDDTSSQDVETAKEITDAVRASLRDGPTEDVKTARSPGENSLKTAIESDQVSRSQPTEIVLRLNGQHSDTSSCTTAGLNRELDSMVNTAQTFLLPVGTLAPDVQRSVTEIHGSQQQLAHTPQAFDGRAALSARNLGDAPNKAHLASVEGDVKTAHESPSDTNLATARCFDTPTKDVKTAVEASASLCALATARSECDTSSKDVETAKEITDEIRQLFAAASSSPYEDMNTDQAFVLPGTLVPDVQRSVTEIHGSQQQLTKTPQAFDGRAALSARNLGDAPNKAHLASVEGDVKTARESPSSTELATARYFDTPTKDVQTAVEASASLCDLATGRCFDTPTKDVVTARSPGEKSLTAASEYNESLQQISGSRPTQALHLDAQRSITEIHGSQKQLAQTPHTFDARAALSARNLGDAPNKAHLASVEGDVKTAHESPSDTNLATARCFDTPTKDVKTAVEPSSSLCDLATGRCFDTPTKGVVTARSPGEKSLRMARAASSDVSTAAETSSSSNISSLSRYHSFENIHPEIPPRLEDEEDNGVPTPEQLLAEDRKKRDPSSYYYEPSLNKGPVDRAPRLRAVSSQYAVHELSNYAMDEPSQQYKLKTKTLQQQQSQPTPAPSQPQSSSSSESNLELRCVPSEYALDNPEHAYNHKSAIHHHDAMIWHKK